MINILPGILTTDPQEIKRRIGLMQGHAACMHIDIMDGVFVKSTSMSITQVAQTLSQIDFSMEIEMHLMIEEPVQFISDLAKIPHLSRVIVHKDAIKDLAKTVTALQQIPAKVGLSIGLDENIDKKIPHVDFFCTLAEDEPGFSGTPFNMDALDQIMQLKEIFPGATVEVDGGINDINARICLRHGADEFVSNSYIFKSADPIAALTYLQNLKPNLKNEQPV